MLKNVLVTRSTLPNTFSKRPNTVDGVKQVLSHIDVQIPEACDASEGRASIRLAGELAAKLDANNLSMRLQGRTSNMPKTPFSDRIRRISAGVCLGGSPLIQTGEQWR
jgi:hypothetical protein